MGAQAGSWPARRNALSRVAGAPAETRERARVSPDLIVLIAISALLMIAGIMRREFLGDGVRHLHAILSDQIQAGEPRWLLFPPLASVWVRALSAAGVIAGPEGALRALVVLSIASGILFLFSIRAWLRSESEDDARRAAALLLAGSCAPVLILFSDIAEPQVAAAIAAAGLAYARVWRDDESRTRTAMLCAVGAIAIASLIYQGMILALGMLPLVVSTGTVSRRDLLMASSGALVLVSMTMVAAQIATGTSALVAAAAVVQGEHNPLTRSMMASPSPWKYVAAVIAGPPQGIVALENFSGLKALASGVANGNQGAIANVILLLLGFVATAMLVLRGVRDRQWRVLAAAAVILALPVVRNQQYAYVKFYVLWPIPVALLALRCRTRIVFMTATIVLATNAWLVGEQIREGRDRYRDARAIYASATPSTCWLTSGWTPPFPYLWPGNVTPILGTLATGTDPAAQRAALTASLRHCLCESDAVWTDTTSRDAGVVTSIARHFEYRDTDLALVLIDSRDVDGNSVPGVWVYSDSARQRRCRAVQ
jgi:hypothetical protein